MNGKISITGLQGKQIRNTLIRSGEIVQVDLNEIPAGMYIARLETANGTVFQRLVKE